MALIAALLRDRQDRAVVAEAALLPRWRAIDIPARAWGLIRTLRKAARQVIRAIQALWPR